MLPATRHKWTHTALTPAMQAGTRFTYPGGMEGWIDLIDLIAPRPGVEPATYRSLVQRSTNATTKNSLLTSGVVFLTFWPVTNTIQKLICLSIGRSMPRHWETKLWTSQRRRSDPNQLYFMFAFCFMCMNSLELAPGEFNIVSLIQIKRQKAHHFPRT